MLILYLGLPHRIKMALSATNARRGQDGSAGNETVIVQIIGEGPTEGGEVDPKQSTWIQVPQ